MNHAYFGATRSRTARISFPVRHHLFPFRSLPTPHHLCSANSVATMAAPTTQPEPVIISGKRYRPISEGLASILAPYRDSTTPTEPGPLKKPKNYDEGAQAVCYNPIQQLHRE